MDISTIIGIVLAWAAVIGSIAYGSPLSLFWDIPSAFCVFGGVIGSTFARFPLDLLKTTGKMLAKSVFFTPADSKKTIDEIYKLAETARRESVFALEKVQVEDAFMKKAMTLAADNRPPDVISAILQMEIDSMKGRHAGGLQILDAWADAGPSFGMIGTLIGLVQMLQNMSDPSSIGPAMAVALITTFYGAVITHCIAVPLKKKLEIRSGDEVTKMTIIIAGTLGIVAGENPRLIKEKLNSFLSPAERFADAAPAEGGAATAAPEKKV